MALRINSCRSWKARSSVGESTVQLNTQRRSLQTEASGRVMIRNNHTNISKLTQVPANRLGSVRNISTGSSGEFHIAEDRTPIEAQIIHRLYGSTSTFVGGEYAVTPTRD